MIPSGFKMRYFANNESPDEIPSTLFVKTKRFSEKERKFYLEIIPCDPLIYTMDRPKFILSKKKEE